MFLYELKSKMSDHGFSLREMLRVSTAVEEEFPFLAYCSSSIHCLGVHSVFIQWKRQYLFYIIKPFRLRRLLTSSTAPSASTEQLEEYIVIISEWNSPQSPRNLLAVGALIFEPHVDKCSSLPNLHFVGCEVSTKRCPTLAQCHTVLYCTVVGIIKSSRV